MRRAAKRQKDDVAVALHAHASAVIKAYWRPSSTVEV